MARASWRERIATAKAERIAASRVRVLRAVFELKQARKVADARRLFFASIIYLPLIWILMIADRV